MKGELKRYLHWAELSFFGFLAACIALRPSSLSANSGISYFGNYKETLLPYAFALLLPAWFINILVSKLPSSSTLYPPLVRRWLTVVPLLAIGLVLTPSNTNTSIIINWLHAAFGTMIFSIQIVVSSYWGRVNKRDKITLALLAAEVFSGIASAIYLPASSGLLLQSQLIFQAAFLILLGRTFNFIALKKPTS